MISKLYFHHLVQYNKILSERNALLKMNEMDDRLLDVYDQRLSEFAKTIFSARESFIAQLNKEASRVHSELTNGKEQLSLHYEADLEGEDALLEKLQKRRQRDKNNRTTSAGTHLDDVKITINEIDVRRFGSQGQVRSAAISIFLGLIPFITRHTGKKPIVLLDDVFSELDSTRRQNMLEHISSYQVFITATDTDGIDFPASVIEIEDGLRRGGLFG